MCKAFLQANDKVFHDHLLAPRWQNNTPDLLQKSQGLDQNLGENHDHALPLCHPGEGFLQQQGVQTRGIRQIQLGKLTPVLLQKKGPHTENHCRLAGHNEELELLRNIMEFFSG